MGRPRHDVEFIGTQPIKEIDIIKTIYDRLVNLEVKERNSNTYIRQTAFKVRSMEKKIREMQK